MFLDIGANLATRSDSHKVFTKFLIIYAITVYLLQIQSGNNLCSLLLIAIFLLLILLNNFPVAYIDDAGLTLFKVASEYIITAVFLMTAGLLVLKRQEFSSSVFRLLVGALVTAAAAELAFTLYVDVYGIANMVGHLLNVVSFYLIYRH